MEKKPELYICDIAEECQKAWPNAAEDKTHCGPHEHEWGCDGGCGVNPKSKGCVPIVKGFHQMEKMRK